MPAKKDPAKKDLKAGSKISKTDVKVAKAAKKTEIVSEQVGKQVAKKTAIFAKKVGKEVTKVAKKVAEVISKKPVQKAAGKPAGRGASAGKKSLTQIDDKYVQSLQKDIDEMMRLLCQRYPDADCELTYESSFQLLTAVIMSAQTTDVSVNKVTPVLYGKYPDAKSLAIADIEDVKQIIRTTGFFNAKANNIQRCAQALVERFSGKVPQTLEELVTLPGVGRKTANVVLGVCFGKPGWTVDTHVQRLVRRLGITSETDPEKIEYALQKIFPNQDWSKYSITLIWHGRRICFARKPDCPSCPIKHICPSSQAP